MLSVSQENAVHSQRFERTPSHLGVQPPEAVGIESALAGLRDTILDDDQLLALASNIFDGLLASFEKGQK